MLKKVAIFKALDVEIKKQRGPVAVKDAYKGHHSLKEELSQPGISILGEVAGGDPGRGQVRESYKASTHAKSLVENGAKGLSVATDKFLYHGEDKHLSEVRGQVKVPLIRRDFIFEDYQVEESKILGADAIFLMPALLSQDRLESLLKFATSKGMDVVVDITSEGDLARALEAGADIICAVGRNLETWEASWDQAIALLKKIPKTCLKMVEGGIHRLDQIKELEAMGVHGLLIGDALLDDYYPGKRLAQILAGVEPPKKAAKPKGKTGSAAVAAQAPTAAPAAKDRISTQRKEAAQPGAKDAKGSPSSRTTPSNLAQKGVKEPPMAEMTNPVATPELDAAKKPAKKAAPKKKAAAKKPAVKKAAAKKPAAKKPAVKKAAAKKPAAKKPAVKKAVAKKPAVKKAVKKAAPKKAAAKKPAVKKAAPKKAAVKKAAPKKAVVKKAAPKKVVAKKAAPKKVVAKKAAPKKAVAKKPAVKKAAPKKAAKK